LIGMIHKIVDEWTRLTEQLHHELDTIVTKRMKRYGNQFIEFLHVQLPD